MSSAKPRELARDRFLAQQSARADLLDRGAPAWLQQLRASGRERFASDGLPGVKDEAWKYSSLRTLARTELAFADTPGEASDVEAMSRLPGEESHRLVFVDGHWSPELSDLSDCPGGLELGSLREALSREPAAVEPWLGKLAREGDALAALNDAFLFDGAWIRLKAGCAVERPIHVVFLTTSEAGPRSCHPRLLLVAEENSEARIVEQHIGSTGETYFANAVSELWLGQASRIQLYGVQRQSDNAFHVGNVWARQERDSTLRAHCFANGAAMGRVAVHAELAGPHAECTIEGLYLAAGQQSIDYHTCIDHVSGDARSRECFHGILNDKARGAFTGRIIFRPGADGSDTAQTNRNLLLSGDAEADTRPQLEIHADDVKASHGATVGSLDPEALFYLRQRGLSEPEARQVLCYGFAAEMLDPIKVGWLRAGIEDLLWAWLPGSLERGEDAS